jgi:hypothetical protein
MKTIRISHRHARMPRFVRPFAAAIRALGGWASKGLFSLPGPEPDWRSLNERLLRDIGESPAGAEAARLSARMGVVETDASEPLSFRGLQAGHFIKWMKRNCHRKAD